jgi:hypothetical protein
MFEQVHPTDLVESHQKEAIKCKFFYDEYGRMITSHTAETNAKPGARTFRTDYTYYGTSNLTDKMKESFGVWLAEWEM